MFYLNITTSTYLVAEVHEKLPHNDIGIFFLSASGPTWPTLTFPISCPMLGLRQCTGPLNGSKTKLRLLLLFLLLAVVVVVVVVNAPQKKTKQTEEQKLANTLTMTTIVNDRANIHSSSPTSKQQPSVHPSSHPSGHQTLPQF